MTVDVERLLNDSGLLLYSMDFHTWTADFYEVDEAIPVQHCPGARSRPHHRISLDTLMGVELPSPACRHVHFLWMTDFCGSTLLARALHGLGAFYLYNETDLFRSLASARRQIELGNSELASDDWERLLRLALHVQAKTPHAGRIALVKEWPLSNVIIPDILSAGPESRGLFLYAPLEEYLSACLKSAYRRNLARCRVEEDLTEIDDLAPLAGIDRHGLEDSQAAALHWLTLAYLHTERRYGDLPQLRTLSNGVFFAQPHEALLAVARHLEASVSDGDVDEIVRGPIFQQYSKDPNVAFSLIDRQQAILAANSKHREEIDAALAWAAPILDAHPLPDEFPVPLREI